MFQLIETVNTKKNIKLYLSNIKQSLIQILSLKLNNIDYDIIYRKAAFISHLFNIIYATKTLHYTLRLKLIQTICRIIQMCLQ